MYGEKKLGCWGSTQGFLLDQNAIGKTSAKLGNIATAHFLQYGRYFFSPRHVDYEDRDTSFPHRMQNSFSGRGAWGYLASPARGNRTQRDTTSRRSTGTSLVPPPAPYRTFARPSRISVT